jgi:cellulose biosynthesis protein BcsQ
MNVPVVTFFNNKGGVGQTSLVYHLAWMFSDLNVRVIAVDLDPQANLTAAFVDDDRLEELWTAGNEKTVFGSLQPLLKGAGDIVDPYLESISEALSLIVGDLGLSGFEEELASQWSGCFDGRERSFRVISAFWRIIQRAAWQHEASLVLVDLGPNLGAINRAGLIASNYVVVPLSPDLFSLQGLRNLGPPFQRWRREWQERLSKAPTDELELPPIAMQPLGYIVLQHSVRLDRPVASYDKWMNRIPDQYRSQLLKQVGDSGLSVRSDPENLALLRHYRSLMPMAQEVRKPIFHLKAADGAIGAHFNVVQEAYRDFKRLALRIAERARVPVSIC